MAALAWGIAPWVADRLDGPAALARALIVSITVGMVWQFLLVLFLVHRERGSVRWPVLKDALWLRAPRSPKTGRVGGRLWLVIIPCLVLFAAEELVPSFSPVAGHDLPTFLESDAGSRSAVRQLGLGRCARRAGRLQHRPRRGAPVPRTAAAADARCLRSR